MKFGCHVSIAQNIALAPGRAAALGCEVFQIFSRPPQGGKAPELTPAIILDFKSNMKKFGFAEALVHTPYFINYGSAETRIFYGSITVVRQELDRASALGIPYVVTHLGSYKDLGRKKGLLQVVSGLQKTFGGYKGSARLLIENSAGAGDIIGDEFEEIAEIAKNKKLAKLNIGACLDTCHAFASGYDLRDKKSVNATIKDFDRVVGVKYLKAIHANDSKMDLGGKRDRHEHIGLGKIGEAGFAALVCHPKLQKINMYLETEHDFVKEDLEILKNMRGDKLSGSAPGFKQSKNSNAT